MTRTLTELAGDLRERLVAVRMGGSESARARHLERGKLLARNRVDRLLDPGSPFLELSALAAVGMYDDAVPSAGIVTGIGRISGRECVVVANDATVTPASSTCSPHAGMSPRIYFVLGMPSVPPPAQLRP